MGGQKKFVKSIKKILRRRIPISQWISSYSKDYIISDLIAGITISLTIIPQSIAYAALAGLDPQYGLNSAFMGCFVYVFFGTIKEVVIGPSSLMSLLTYEYTYNLNPDFVILLCFISGIVEFLMGVFQLGFLVSFISAPVISGFTSATSIIIIVSQIKGLLGVHFKSHGFIDNLRKLYENMSRVRTGDAVLGFICVVGLLSLRKIKEINIPESIPQRKFFTNVLWFLSTGRNALAVFLASSASAYYKLNNHEVPFITTKAVDSGIPTWKFPPTSTHIGNQTYNLQEMISELGTGCIVLPVISIFVNVAIAKAFANGTIDVIQEMLALSLSNLLGAFVQSMPTSGAFTRSAVISSSGVRTPFACLYSAIITLLALHFLGPYFHFIPRCALASVLICAVMFLIDWKIVLTLWKTNRMDLLTLLASFFASLYVGVEFGLVIGVIIGVGNLLYKWARPNISITKTKSSIGGYVVLKPELGIYFPSVDYIISTILKNAQNEYKEKLPVVLDCSDIKGSDFSAAKNLKILSNTFNKREQQLVFLNVPKRSQEMWITAGCSEQLFTSSDNLETAIFGDTNKHCSTGFLTSKEDNREELEMS